jgi:hypothetical protein
LGFQQYRELFSPDPNLSTYYDLNKDSMFSCVNHPDTPVLFHTIIAPSVLTWCNIANLSWEEASEACNSMTCLHVTKQAGHALHHPTEIIVSMTPQRKNPH